MVWDLVVERIVYYNLVACIHMRESRIKVPQVDLMKIGNVAPFLYV